MGFFDTLEKIFYGAGDFIAEAGNQYSKQVDRMTDEEIEGKYSESVDEVRNRADTLRSQAEIWKMKRHGYDEDDDYID